MTWYDDIVISGCKTVADWNTMIDYIAYSSACTFTIYDSIGGTTQKFKFTYSGNISTEEGAALTGKTLRLKADTADAYPYIDLIGNAGIDNLVTAGSYFKIKDATETRFQFSKQGGESLFTGRDATGGYMHIGAALNDTYPYIYMHGNDYIKLYTKNDIYFMQEAVQVGKLSYTANLSTMCGGGVTGDDLTLKANTIDTYPYINLFGDSGVDIRHKSTSQLSLYEEATEYFQFYYTATNTESRIEARNSYNIGLMVADTKNIIMEDTDIFFQFNRNVGNSRMYGSNDAGDDMYIYTNSSDAYPYMKLTGGEEISLYAAFEDEIYLYSAATQMARFDFISSERRAYWKGPPTAGDKLQIKCNDSDAYPYIDMLGGTEIRLYAALEDEVRLYSATTNMFTFDWVSSGRYSKLYGGPSSADKLNIYANSTDAYPNILLNGNADILLRTHSNLSIYQDSTSEFIFAFDANTSFLCGKSASGKNLCLNANNNDPYPFIQLTGNAEVQIAAKDGTAIYMYDGGTQDFKFYMSGDCSVLRGQNATAKHLELKANETDASPYILLLGNSNIILRTPSNIIFQPSNLDSIEISHSGIDIIFLGTGIDHNLYLQPNGTGKVKFGAYSALGAEVLAGFITILDSGGNTRKLAVVA